MKTFAPTPATPPPPQLLIKLSRESLTHPNMQSHLILYIISAAASDLRLTG